MYFESSCQSLQLQWVKAEGVAHPVLKIEIGLASRQCQGPELDEYAEAIISQVESAMHEQFSDEAGCPEQMVVIANCAGAYTMQARQTSCEEHQESSSLQDTIPSWRSMLSQKSCS